VVVNSYRMLLDGKEKMIFVVLERGPCLTPRSDAASTAETWRSRQEDIHVSWPARRQSKAEPGPQRRPAGRAAGRGNLDGGRD
jgi:hypothetical protein